MRGIVGFLVLILLSPAVSFSQAQDTAAEVRELKKRLELLERKMAEEEEQRKKEREELERKTQTLAQEIERKRVEEHIPTLAELKPQYGLAPAASRVYAIRRGLSLGAYGEANYRKLVTETGTNRDTADFLRLVAYLGYKFNDWMVFNSEIEFEHGTTGTVSAVAGGGGSVSVEFAILDFLLSRPFNARAGMVLAPLGFINEIHEPPFFHGVLRPDVETQIIPTTWRGVGAGFFGELLPGLQYRTYLMEGLRASRFTRAGIAPGRQQANRVLFEDPSWAFRLDYTPERFPGLLVGASTFLGNQGQDETVGGRKPSAFMILWDLHAQLRYRGLELRALGAWNRLDDARELSLAASAANRPIASRQFGWYVEAAYDIFPLLRPGTTQYLAPFFRFERYDTQAEVPSGFARDPSRDRKLYTLGLSYKPIPNIVLKIDYRNFDAKGPRDVGDEVAIGIGFAF